MDFRALKDSKVAIFFQGRGAGMAAIENSIKIFNSVLNVSLRHPNLTRGRLFFCFVFMAPLMSQHGTLLVGYTIIATAYLHFVFFLLAEPSFLN